MKRKIAALVVFVAIAVMSISGTMAYFTADSIATNVITAGNLDITLIEMEKVGDKKIPFKNKEGVMPGQEISKIVTVYNEGDYPAYVRIKVTKAIKLAEGMNGKADTDLISYTVLDGWTKVGDYYYYNEPLAPKTETTPLFETVKFSTTMDNTYQGCEATIDVAAEAVQVKNNGKTVFEAKGWPNTPVAE